MSTRRRRCRGYNKRRVAARRLIASIHADRSAWPPIAPELYSAVLRGEIPEAPPQFGVSLITTRRGRIVSVK